MPSLTPSVTAGPEAASTSSRSNSTCSAPGQAMPAATQQPKDHGIAMREAMASCAGLKEQYDRCFNHWYRHHFLQGDMSRNCFHFFADYRVCISEELKQKGLE